MIHAESAMADSTMYVEDAGTLAPVADAATVQLAKIEHQMITATELYDLLDLALSGVRQLASGSFVEFWLHDPVDELDRHFDPVGVVSGKVRLLTDSFDLMNLYSEEPSWDRTPGDDSPSTRHDTRHKARNCLSCLSSPHSHSGTRFSRVTSHRTEHELGLHGSSASRYAMNRG